MVVCEKAGHSKETHFATATKLIKTGKWSVEYTDDYHLSRYACYLIAETGLQRKPQIALAKHYFAITIV
jgi:DNA-damage-inducible protein D